MDYFQPKNRVVRAWHLPAEGNVLTREILALADARGWDMTSGVLLVKTENGGVLARNGDWIVERAGGFAVLNDQDFWSEYERVPLNDVHPDPVVALTHEIKIELNRARQKFPGKNVTFAALVEEVGELSTAAFSEPRANVRSEAVQVAVMAMRMVLDGDHTFDAWRQKKGLDALVEAAIKPAPIPDDDGAFVGEIE